MLLALFWPKLLADTGLPTKNNIQAIKGERPNSAKDYHEDSSRAIEVLAQELCILSEYLLIAKYR